MMPAQQLQAHVDSDPHYNYWLFLFALERNQWANCQLLIKKKDVYYF